MDDTVLAYIAGFFDGDGSVTFILIKSSNDKKRRGRLTSRISQNDRVVLDWIQTITGVGSVHPRKRELRWKLQHDYVVAYEAARYFLCSIFPYLIVKQERVREKLWLDRETVSRRSKEPLPNESLIFNHPAKV